MALTSVPSASKKTKNILVASQIECTSASGWNYFVATNLNVYGYAIIIPIMSAIASLAQKQQKQESSQAFLYFVFHDMGIESLVPTIPYCSVISSIFPNATGVSIWRKLD